MRLATILTLPLALAALASCAPVPNDHCAGWRPVRMAGASIDYLAAHDPAALSAVIGHMEFGAGQGCW